MRRSHCDASLRQHPSRLMLQYRRTVFPATCVEHLLESGLTGSNLRALVLRPVAYFAELRERLEASHRKLQGVVDRNSRFPQTRQRRWTQVGVEAAIAAR